MLPSRAARLAYVGMALADTALAGSRHPVAHRARVLTKPLLMPLLATSLARSPGAAGSPLRTPVLAAQAAGWVGDLALMSSRRPAFVAGASAFAAGHAAYVAGFHALHSPGSRLVDEPAFRALAAVWALSAPVLGVSAQRRAGLGLAVAAYSTALVAMTVSATRLGDSVPAAARRCAAAGSLLFLASDSTLGLRQFVLSEPPPRVESAVMATYTAAQLLLSEAAARA